MAKPHVIGSDYQELHPDIYFPTRGSLFIPKIIKVETIKHKILVTGMPLTGLTRAYERPNSPNPHNTKI